MKIKKKIKGHNHDHETSLEFGDIPFFHRFRIWWSFTKAVLFKQEEQPNITIMRIAPVERRGRPKGSQKKKAHGR